MAPAVTPVEANLAYHQRCDYAEPQRPRGSGDVEAGGDHLVCSHGYYRHGDAEYHPWQQTT